MPSSGGQKCARSEEHTSELQSHDNLVCRLLLEKKQHRVRCPPPAHGRGPRPGPPPAPGGARAADGGEGREPAAAEEAGVAQVVTDFFLKNTDAPELATLSLPAPLPI